VSFILEPLYKLYIQVIGEDTASLSTTLKGLGIYLKQNVLSMDVKPLLGVVCEAFFGPATGFVDMVVNHLPSPVSNAASKVKHIWTGDMDSELAEAMINCDPAGPLMIHVTKMYNSVDMGGFEAFGRVMSGTVKTGMKVRVLGERYTPDDEEDMVTKEVEGLSIYESRYRFLLFLLNRNLSI
jgi:116 kDa U5 small nuclear ribonucleoprotein component